MYALALSAAIVPSACLLPEVELIDGDPGAGRAGGLGAGGRNGMGAGGTAGAGTGIAKNCNWASPSCDALSCDSACPTDDGGYCDQSCEAIVKCVSDNPECMTKSDPTCGLRTGLGRPNLCTHVWETASGSPMNSPAQVALAFVECVCGL